MPPEVSANLMINYSLSTVHADMGNHTIKVEALLNFVYRQTYKVLLLE